MRLVLARWTDRATRGRWTFAAGAVIGSLLLVSCGDAAQERGPGAQGAQPLSAALEHTDAALRDSHRPYEALERDGTLIRVRTSLEPVPTALASAVSMCRTAAEIVGDSYLVAVHASTGRMLSLSVDERCKRAHLKARTTLWRIPG